MNAQLCRRWVPAVRACMCQSAGPRPGPMGPIRHSTAAIMAGRAPAELAFILAGAAARQVGGLVGDCCRKEDIAATPLSAKPLIPIAGSGRRSPPQAASRDRRA